MELRQQTRVSHTWSSWRGRPPEMCWSWCKRLRHNQAAPAANRGSVTLEGGSCSSVRPMNLLLSNVAAPYLKIHLTISPSRFSIFWYYSISIRTQVESRSWRDRNLKFGPNYELAPVTIFWDRCLSKVWVKSQLSESKKNLERRIFATYSVSQQKRVFV